MLSPHYIPAVARSLRIVRLAAHELVTKGYDRSLVELIDKEMQGLDPDTEGGPTLDELRVRPTSTRYNLGEELWYTPRLIEVVVVDLLEGDRYLVQPENGCCFEARHDELKAE